MLVVKRRCEFHVHEAHRPPRPSLEIAAALAGLAACWTELDWVCADWEGRPRRPVSQVEVLDAIRRVRAQERRRASNRASAARYRRRRARRAPAVAAPVPVVKARVTRLVWEWPPPREVAPQLYRPAWNGREMVWTRVVGTLNLPLAR